MKWDTFVRYSWCVLVAIQVGCVVYFFDNTQAHGLYNTDAFSYHVQWSKVSYTLSPFSEAVVADPGHDLVRIPFAYPHFLMGITSRYLGPEITYLAWCCVGVLTTYFSLVWFALALGFNRKQAQVAALVHYTFFHLLSQLPPLSGNQLDYIFECLLLKPENIQHFGPRQYPHDIFFYPLLYSVLALTLFGIKRIKERKFISGWYLALWGVLCGLMPFNYFYHWFQFAFTLGGVVVVGFVLKWWTFGALKNYTSTVLVFWVVLAGWAVVVFFQNSQLSDAAGYRFSLMGGLTEARFWFLPFGLLVRVGIWAMAAMLVLRLNQNAVLLSVFLIGCLVLMNMQMIVGKNIQPGHWSFGIDRVCAWIAILVAVKLVQNGVPKWMPALTRVLVCVSMVFFFLQSWSSWQYFERQSRWSAQRAELIAFLASRPQSSVLVPELWLETDILIHTHHFSFLPRAAQSALSPEEHLERVAHAAWTLGYSRQGFLDWVHIRSVRFFGMLYGTSKDFSSTYFHLPDKKEAVLEFWKGTLPEWDWEIIENYRKSPVFLPKKLDLIVLHASETMPDSGSVIFRNERFIVMRADPLKSKAWGNASPIDEQR